MKAFIETSKGSYIRTRYDEKTFRFKESFEIKYKYPFDYGFIIGTNNTNKDCIDCYILSHNRIKEGRIVECDPEFLIEMYEDGEIDHKVIMKTKEYKVEDINEIANTIKTFILNVFAQFPEVEICFGEIKNKAETECFIEGNMD